MIKISIVLATTAVFAALLIAYPFSPSSSSGSRPHVHKPTVTHTASRKPTVSRRTPAAAIADADREVAGSKPES